MRRTARIATSLLRILPIVVGSAMLASCASTKTPDAHQQTHAPEILSPEQVSRNLQSFDKVWETVKVSHFDPTLGGVDWDAAKAKYRPKVEQATTMAAARMAMNEMLGELKHSHTGIIPVEAYQETAAAKSDSKAKADVNSGGSKANESTSPGDAGLSLRVLGDAAVVTKVRAGSPAEAAGIKLGWALVSAGGSPVTPTIKKIREAVAPNNEQEFLLSRAVESKIDGKLGETIKMTFEDGTGSLVEKSVMLAAPAGNVVTMLNLPPIPVDFESRKIPAGAGGSVGYIWFSIFLDPGSLTPKINDAMRSFKDCRGVVLDLRGNPGGIGAMSMGIAGWFITEPKALGEMIMRGTSLKFVANPRAATFDKPLAILVDGCSVSTSEIMAGGMKDIGRARLFGTRTAGAALPSALERLPNGDALQYVIANYISAGGKPLEGDGVSPDEIVPLDRAELLKGHDNQLDAALKWINNSKPTAAQ